jgi:hypothetical protein
MYDERLRSKQRLGLMATMMSLFGIIGLNWLIFATAFLSVLLVPMTLVGVSFFVIKRRLWAALILLVTVPPAFFFMSGVRRYIDGSAKLIITGLPFIETFNLDPETRCRQTTSGCIVRGNEWCTHDSYNFAIRLMILCFGEMPREYHGPYPSREEAISTFAQGVPVT